MAYSKKQLAVLEFLYNNPGALVPTIVTNNLIGDELKDHEKVEMIIDDLIKQGLIKTQLVDGAPADAFDFFGVFELTDLGESVVENFVKEKKTKLIDRIMTIIALVISTANTIVLILQQVLN